MIFNKYAFLGISNMIIFVYSCKSSENNEVRDSTCRTSSFGPHLSQNFTFFHNLLTSS